MGGVDELDGMYVVTKECAQSDSGGDLNRGIDGYGDG